MIEHTITSQADPTSAMCMGADSSKNGCPLTEESTEVTTNTTTSTSTTTSTRTTPTTAITTIKTTTTTTSVTTTTTTLHHTLDVDVNLFHRLQPIHYLILAELKKDIPIKLLRVSRDLYEEIIPQLYQNFYLDETTYEKKLYGAFKYPTQIEGYVFDEEGTEERLFEPASSRKVDALRQIRTLYLTDVHALQKLSEESVPRKDSRRLVFSDFLGSIPCIAIDHQITKQFGLTDVERIRVSGWIDRAIQALSLTSVKLMWPNQGRYWLEADEERHQEIQDDNEDDDKSEMADNEDHGVSTRPFNATEIGTGTFIKDRLGTCKNLTIVYIGVAPTSLLDAFPYITQFKSKKLEIVYQLLWEKIPTYDVALQCWRHFINVRKLRNLSPIYSSIYYELSRYPNVARLLPKLFRKKAQGNEVLFQEFKDSLRLSR